MTGPPVAPPYPSRVDLHAHSRRSDGVLEPRALVEAAAISGVRVLALSDHDTLAGVRELCGPGAPELPLHLVPAVEINSVAGGIDGLWEGELHILGLGVDPGDDAFEAALQRQRVSRARRFAMILDCLRNLDMPVDEGAEALSVEPGSSLGRPQIARLLDPPHGFGTADQCRFGDRVRQGATELFGRGLPGQAVDQRVLYGR